MSYPPLRKFNHKWEEEKKKKSYKKRVTEQREQNYLPRARKKKIFDPSEQVKPDFPKIGPPPLLNLVYMLRRELTGGVSVKWPSPAMEWLIALIVINDLAGRSRKLQNHVRAQSPPTVIVAKVISRNYPPLPPPPRCKRQLVRLLITGGHPRGRHV